MGNSTLQTQTILIKKIDLPKRPHRSWPKNHPHAVPVVVDDQVPISQLNPISADWGTVFQHSDLYQKISHQYQHLATSTREVTMLKAALHRTVYETARKFCHDYAILDAVPYYYIQYLTDIDPKTFVDIGCGLNVFKKTFPNLQGIDNDPQSRYDVFDTFDEDFVKGHANQFDAVITINTIHFASIDTISERLAWIQQILAPGGRAFVSFNLETWLMYTGRSCVEQLFGSIPIFQDVVRYVDHAIDQVPVKYLVRDWPILRTTTESTIRDDYNGNIRLVFEK
jgi:SAM-dependent methyltransferase